MAARSMLLRGFAVLFSMLLVGIYIYNRAGGKLLPAETDSTAAADTSTNVDDPRFVGSKSAAVFEPITPSVATGNTGSSATQLLPGSKIAVLATTATAENPQAAPVPGEANPQLLPGSKSLVLPSYNNPPPPPAQKRLMPGSKSAGVFRPAPQPAQAAEQPNPEPQAQAAQPKQQQLLPGSKRDLVFDPKSFEPQPAPESKLVPRKQPPVANNANLPRQEAPPQPVPPKKQRMLPGPKSSPAIDEEALQRAPPNNN